jgi:transcriptional regulator with XRE-family HTH domain
MIKNQTFNELFKSVRTEPGYKVDGLILEITEQIVTQMEAEDISKSELASRIKVSAPYITKLLRGETNFTAESIVKIADALNCDVDVKLIPRTNVRGWVELLGKTVKTRPEFQVWAQDARTYRGGMKSFHCPSNSQSCYYESH